MKTTTRAHLAVPNAALLARGERVLGIDNLNDYYDPSLKQARIDRLNRQFGDSFKFERVDFADARALGAALDGTEVDRIVHLGAQAGVRYSLENPGAYVQSNLVGHVNMLELARHRGSSHFVYASSSSVYGGNKSLPFRVEDRVDHPLSLYAATKKADELMSETYAHLYRLPLTGLRFFTVYGPWGRPDMAVWLFTAAILVFIFAWNDFLFAITLTSSDDARTVVKKMHEIPIKDDVVRIRDAAGREWTAKFGDEVTPGIAAAPERPGRSSAARASCL